MVVKLALTVLVIATPAFAEPVPGSGGDPLRELMVNPAFTYTDLPSGLPVRGGNPEDTLLLFDGFELPWAFHGSGLRSIVAPGAADVELDAGSFGVEHGRGSSLVTISPRTAEQGLFGELTVLDAHAHSSTDRVGSSIRVGHDAFVQPWRDTGGERFLDALAYLDVRLSKHWTLPTSVIGATGDGRYLYRVVTGARYESRDWSASFAVSPLAASAPNIRQLSFDTRAEVIRRAATAAGLRELEWRIGQDTRNTRFTLATARPWRNDLGLWSSVGAKLSSRVHATAGLRVDLFENDLATQPRGRLAIGLTRHLEVALAAGAYRRPPRQLAEVATDTLNPERATHVALSGTFDENRGYRITGATYYIDRRRLVARDSAGELGNSGFGTSYGVELGGTVRHGPWSARIASALARSQRFDYLRARERPAPFEQPFRLELLGAWTRQSITISARLQLASGLPYTPYTDSVYDSDSDTYEPLYVEPLSARTPFHHQVDVRVDYRFALGRVPFHAFVDLHNAYGNSDAIGYQFSYDYRSRAAITALPVFPFAGLRGYL